MRRLRRKVELDPDRPVLVLTVRGSGYKIGDAGPDAALPGVVPVSGRGG